MPGGSLKNYVGTYEGGFKGGLPEGQGKFTAAKGGKVFEVNLYHSKEEVITTGHFIFYISDLNPGRVQRRKEEKWRIHRHRVFFNLHRCQHFDILYPILINFIQTLTSPA